MPISKEGHTSSLVLEHAAQWTSWESKRTLLPPFLLACNHHNMDVMVTKRITWKL